MWGDVGRYREVSGRYRRGEGGLQQARRGGGGARRELDAAVPGHERGDEEVLHAVERREERAAREQAAPLQPDRRGEREEAVPVRGLGRRSAALRGPLEGWWVASKRLGPLPRIRRGALGRGCGREGRGALPLPRAAVISSRHLNRLERTARSRASTRTGARAPRRQARRPQGRRTPPRPGRGHPAPCSAPCRARELGGTRRARAERGAREARGRGRAPRRTTRAGPATPPLRRGCPARVPDAVEEGETACEIQADTGR